MSDGFVQIPTDGGGKHVDNSVFNRSGTDIYRQRVEVYGPGLSNLVPVAIGDGPNLDAFSRLRVSNPYNQFSAFNEYNLNVFNWITAVAGTGAVSHSTVSKTVTLSTGGTLAAARAVLQSRYYMRYIPGKSLFVAETFTLGPAVSGCAKRVGYYDDDNGIFLERTVGAVSLVRRSKVSGNIVETRVEQAQWNKDTLDGTGTSGLTLNLDYAQILLIDLQFLGVGRVRVYFDIAGIAVQVHEFVHANTNTGQPYMATANLPIRYEVVNTGVAASIGTINCICAKVDSEGGWEPGSVQYSVSNGATSIVTSTTLKPILSIRPSPTFGGITHRGWVVPRECRVFCKGTPDHLYQLIWNATLTGASWQPVNTNSATQFDVSSTAVSLGSGVIVDTDYISVNGAARSGSATNSVFSDRPLANSFDGTTPDTLTIAVRALSSTGVAYGSLTWHCHW